MNRIAKALCALLWFFACATTASPPDVSALQRLPLSFEANAGQFDSQVQFRTRASGKHLFVVRNGMVLVLEPSRDPNAAQAIVRIQFQGASKSARTEGLDRLEAITNYFSAGLRITDVPNFARVRQHEVYPGVDVVYYGKDGRIEYDFIVAPGADPARIALRLDGADAIRLTEAGELVLKTIAGELVMQRPVAYQERDGARIDVPAHYALKGREARFELAAYDRGRPLVIDPILSYSTYLGGSSWEQGVAIAIDSNRNMYIAGETFSTDFPVVSGFQTKQVGFSSVFVTKLNPAGTAILYSTYIGGKSGNSRARGIAVDTAGNAYLAGEAGTTAYPVTTGAYQTTHSAETFDGFITKLAPQGNALVYSTFIRGGRANAIAINSAGNAFVTGQATGAFVTTAGVVQPSFGGGLDAYVLKLNPTGTGLIYGTRLGGQGDDLGRGVAVDAAGNAYVSGITKSTDFPLVNPFQSALRGTQDAFVAKLDATASTLSYSTYLGGSLADAANAIAVDAQGNAHVVGTTYSLDFPVLRAFQPNKAFTGTGHEVINNAFITKLAPSGQLLVYSSYLGGQGCLGGGSSSCSPNGDEDNAFAVAVDAAGIAYLAGYARSVTFPVQDWVQPSSTGYGEAVPFVARVQDQTTRGATLLYSVPLGSRAGSTQLDNPGAGIAVDAAGTAYVGAYIGTPFPVTPGALKTSNVASDAVIFKVALGAFPTTLSVSNPQPTSSDPVTLTAVVTGPAADGLVTFYENGTSIATVGVSGGTASYTTVFNAGVHELTAVYSGDNKVSRSVFLPVRKATSN